MLELNWFITDKASDTLKMSQKIRSSRAALFCKNNVLLNFTIFIEKHLWCSPFWKNSNPTCLKLHYKGRHHRYFPVDKFCEYNFFGSFHSSIPSEMLYKVSNLKKKTYRKTNCARVFFLPELHTIKPPSNFIKKRLQYRCFTVTFAKLFKALWRTPPVSASNFNSTFLTLRQQKIYIYVFRTLLFYDISKPLHVPYRNKTIWFYTKFWVKQVILDVLLY